MRRYRTAVVAVVIIVALVATGCSWADPSGELTTSSSAPESSAQGPAMPTVSLPGEDPAEVQVAHLDEPSPDVGAVTARTDLVDVSITDPLPDGEAAQVRWPLPPDWQQGWVPVIVWEDGEGGWRWLPTQRQDGPDGPAAVAQTDHFSRGFLASFDPAAFAQGLADEATHLFTGRAGATAPVCEGRDAVADLLEVTSDAVNGVEDGDAVLWCAGMQDGEPVLKITNNRRVLTQVMVPTAATVVGQERGISLTKGLAQLGGEIASFAQGLPQDREVLLVEGGATITVQVPRDVASGAEVTASGLGYALSVLILGLDTYTSLAGSAGLKTTATSTDLLHLLGTGAGSAQDWALASVGCLRDFTDIYTDDATAAVDLGMEIQRSLTLLLSCGMKIGAASVDVSGPLGWLVSAVVSTAAGLISLAITAVELLVAVIREAVDAVWAEEDTIYTMRTTPLDPAAVSPSEAALLSGTWSGNVDQPGADPYTVQIVITDDGGTLSAVVEYPELDCGGTWTLTNNTNTDYVFVERIDYGPRCRDEMTIHIEPASGTLRYRIADPYAATAILTREAQPGANTSATDNGWPTTKDTAPGTLYAWFGAAAAAGESSIGLPTWSSCVDTTTVCIASDGDTVAVIERRDGGFVEAHTLDVGSPARGSLLDLGYPNALVNELLAS